MCVGLSASPYYTLWCKWYKMNNNLYFNRHHQYRVSAKHAETIKSTSLRTSARSFTPSLCLHVSAFDQTPSLRTSLMGGPKAQLAYSHSGFKHSIVFVLRST